MLLLKGWAIASFTMTIHISNIESKASTATLTDVPLKTKAARLGPYRAFFKRLLDVTLTLLAMPLVFPVVGLFAAMVALNGGQPFYSQLRVGRNGKHFRIWKMRTMVKNADALLESYLQQNPAARIEWEANQKLKNDPRITRTGRILRKTSMDELPQLWNVLNGTMSLVGPRPIMVDQKAQYHGHSYYNMRPGVTGLWQISDRNNCEFAGRVWYDETYGQMISFKTDLRILRQTVGVVLRATGH